VRLAVRNQYAVGNSNTSARISPSMSASSTVPIGRSCASLMGKRRASVWVMGSATGTTLPVVARHSLPGQPGRVKRAL